MHKIGDVVRIKKQRKGSINEFALVKDVYRKKGETKYWVSNMNMPFQGTISETMSEKELEKVE